MVVLLAVGSRLPPDPRNRQVDARPLVCNDTYPWISANDDERRSARFDIRLDLDPLDLLRALAGVANIGLGPDGERAAKRLVDILIAGVRTRT
jgi:hypothetical protein